MKTTVQSTKITKSTKINIKIKRNLYSLTNFDFMDVTSHSTGFRSSTDSIMQWRAVVVDSGG